MAQLQFSCKGEQNQYQKQQLLQYLFTSQKDINFIYAIHNENENKTTFIPLLCFLNDWRYSVVCWFPLLLAVSPKNQTLIQSLQIHGGGISLAWRPPNLISSPVLAF